ncbi:TraB/GumN family protein [Blastomonas sp.]|uniref:TraB/GumN family protein n=1 Tax=Blastomonas sp. TaxID=1909299 RepID=UPI0026054042|nr:TraB/GumN family protein [Blastomonas sp.]MDM7958011.1 TraB/GumN family protein [Blastomonas sp.]
MMTMTMTKTLRTAASTLALTGALLMSFASEPLLAKDQTSVAEALGAAPAPAAKDINPAMWIVRDADTTIYLFGTVHVLRPGLNWLKGDVKAAFDGSDELVLEVVEPEDPAVTQSIIASMATNPQGTTLRSLLTPPVLGKYESALGTLNIPPAALDGYKPWFAAVTLTTVPLLMQGYDPNSGAEKILSIAAKAQSKPIGQLETIEQQLGIFDKLGIAEQIAFLDVTLDGVPDVTTQIDAMVEAWGKGDLTVLDTLLNEGFQSYPGLYDALLTDRNQNWANWIKARMDKPGTVFIAVGAAHLVGKDSVQVLLEKQGITSTRVAQ